MQNMKVSKSKLAKVFLLFALFGCKGRHGIELNAEEYISSVEKEAPVVFSKTIDNIHYNLLYKPVEYVMLRELREDIGEEGKWEEMKAEYSKYEYYTFEIDIDEFNEEILKYNLKSEEEYAERVNYYAFKFQNDLKLVQDKDTLACSGFHFERNYGLSPKVRFLLSFKKTDINKERTFVCNENYLGNSTVKINIDPRRFEESPTLKLN